MSGAVLVTGASSGIGRKAALLLDRDGYRVFAGVRREPDGESLRREASERLTPVLLDVTDAASIAAAAKEIEAELAGAGLAGLVNNAGIGVGGPLEFLPLEELRRVLEVNAVGVVAVTQACLPLLRRARGRVVVVGSISGRLSVPFGGPYCASKFAVEALCDSLRMELAPWGMQVSLVEPGDVDTPIWEKTQGYADRMLAKLPQAARELYADAIVAVRRQLDQSARGASPPEACARAIAHALSARRPRTRYLVGTDARIQAAVVRFLPDRLRDRLVTRLLAG
jgi:NAD(P)-dependent dehydrogenase (short-subunit alcohol dehydrogenase family)